MLSLNLDLLPIQDSQVIDAFKKIASGLDIFTVEFRWRFFEGETESAILLDQVDADENIIKVLEQRSELMNSCQLGFKVSGPQNQQVGTITVHRKPDGSSTLASSLPELWTSSIPLKTAAAVVVKGAFSPYLKSKVLDRFGPQVADFYAARESTLLRLEALNEKITLENDEHRRALENQIEERERGLAQVHQERLSALETDYATRNDRLNQREVELDDRQKLLDDRSNTHARRQIQRELKEVLKQRNTDFSLTKGTARKRWPSAVAMGILVAAFIVASGWALYATTHLPTPGLPVWYPLIRLGLFLSALGSSIVFFIKWQDRWSEAHAQEEFRMQRFDLDIARASWLVEVMLEWSASKTEFPKELIAKLANGLFEISTTEAGIRHPAEELIAALLSSSNVNLKLPGGTLELDKKAVKEVTKKME